MTTTVSQAWGELLHAARSLARALYDRAYLVVRPVRISPTQRVLFHDDGQERVRQQVMLADGTLASIQASSTHYCTPRESNVAEGYFAVEVWLCPHHPVLSPYGGESDPYAFVPASVLQRYIQAHGGVHPDSKTKISFLEES